MIQELTQLGLTDGEARVYLSLLKIGSSKVGPIVRDSHVSYSKIYDVLERLSMKGLVSHVTIDEVKHFNAIEPYRLQDYIEKRGAAEYTKGNSRSNSAITYQNSQ